MREKLAASILLLLVLLFGLQTAISTGRQDSQINLDEIAVVAAHPFNWAGVAWGWAAEQLHVEFIDRATGFMEGSDWEMPGVDSITLEEATTRNMLTASYMVLTPIPPRGPGLGFRDPQGNLEPILQIAGGRDINQRLIYHSDNIHATMCVSCPDWRQHFIDSAIEILNSGLDAIDVDNIANPPFAFGGDFSVWSSFRFGQYLQDSYSPSELASMGIVDPLTFDIRGYVSPSLDLSSVGDGILVISSPQTVFSSSEVDAIKAFLSQGGGVLIQAEPVSSSIVNQLVDGFGISVKEDRVVVPGPNGGEGSFVIKDLRRDHPIMSGVQSLTYDWGVALEIRNPQATILASTQGDAWIDTNGNLSLDDDEQKGPFPVMVSLEYGGGRLVVVGDRSADCDFDGWRDVMHNTLLWLGRRALSGKTLLFDQTHHEEVAISMEDALKIDRNNPEWYLYSRFCDLAESLGLNVTATRTPPSFPEDSVLREYAKFLHEELQRFVASLANALDEYGESTRGAGVPLFGNQWLGTIPDDNLLRDIALDSILLSPYVDLIQIETTPTLPPANRLTLTYRIGHAMAENAKPVWQLGAFYGGTGLTFSKVNLTALGIAEAYANGAIKELDLAGWPGVPPIAGTVLLPNGTIPSNIESLMDFIWQQRNQLVGFKPSSRVAVVYSIPTFLWSTFPAFGTCPDSERKELIGVADMLQSLHVPYDVIIFGDSQLFNDTYFINRLGTYDVVVLPGVTHLSDYQATALHGYVERGGKLLVTGCIPSYDSEHEPLPGGDQNPVGAILESFPGRTIFLNDSVGMNWYGNMMSLYSNEASYESVIQRFEDSLSVLGTRQEVIVPDLPRLVEMNVLKRNETTVIHLVNYQYQLGSDSFSGLRDVELLVDPPLIGQVDDVTYFSPETEQSLNYSYQDGYLKLEIPSLNYWGFVVFSRCPTLVASLNEHSIALGAPVTVNGTTDPPLAGSTIEILYSSPRGTTVTRRAEVSSEGTFNDSFAPDIEGEWSVEAIWLRSDNSTVSYSSTLSFTVQPSFPLVPVATIVLSIICVIGYLAHRRTERRQKDRPPPGATSDPPSANAASHQDYAAPDTRLGEDNLRRLRTPKPTT